MSPYSQNYNFYGQPQQSRLSSVPQQSRMDTTMTGASATRASKMAGTAGAVASIVQVASQAYSESQRRKAQRYIDKTNRYIAELKAKAALRRGHKKGARRRQEGKQLVGSQRANLAAQGIRLDIGTAQELQQEAQTMTEMDVVTIQNNAAREAFGFSTKASSISLQSQLDTEASRLKAIDKAAPSLARAGGYYAKWKRGR